MNDMQYTGFRDEYEEQHPASVPKRELFREVQEYPSWLIWIVFAMFVASALLSGVHTAPTAYDTIEAAKVLDWVRQFVALGTFVFVELGILISAYLLFKRWSWFAFFILIVCLIIAMVSNLHSVSIALKSSDFGTQIVGIALGMGAPLVAALSGKVFVNLHRADEVARLKAESRYQEARKAFDAEVLTAYEKAKKSSKRLSGVQPVQLSSGQSNGQTYEPSASTLGHQKRPDASETVRRYLAEHSEDIDTEARVLAARLGVGKSTVNNVQRQLRMDAVGLNGHHAEQND